MKSRNIILFTLILLIGVGFSAYSKDAMIAKDALLYVQDPAGENFLVLKVESCSLGNGGAVHCAMKEDPSADRVKAGVSDGFWAKLSYPK